jgi:large subunit ribosomal protein L21
MYALVEIKGKQYKATKGAVLKVDKIGSEKGGALEFDSILMTSEEGAVKIGSPYVAGVKIKATVEDQVKGDKIFVVKFKRRKRYRRRTGHRQAYTLIRIDDIIGA